MSSLFIGIDSGTQSTKAIVLDLESGQIVAHAHRKYDLIEGLPAGHLEQHPSEWITAVEGCISECVEHLGDRRKDIAGIGVSGQQHGLVVLDKDDQVVRPAKLWCDTSTAPQCEQIAHEFGGQPGCIALAGNAILPGYTIPKLLWLKQNEPQNFAKVTSILLPHDYINFWLSGVKRMEYGDASGTGILDVRQRTWNREICDFVDERVLSMLPPLGSSQEVHGTIRPELVKKWGLNDNVIVSAGGGDNMMGAIGTGNVKPGIITASFGTSGTLYGVADAPVVDGQAEVAAFCDSNDLWLPLVCTMNVTVVTEQVREMFGWTIPQLEAAAAEALPGAEGLLFLPYLNGERTPNLPNGTGVIHGLRPGNMNPRNLARAAMEGATLGLAYGLQRFRELGMNPAEIRLTGGGSQSKAWRQLAADIFNAEVVTLATAEGAALGSAIQAAFALQKRDGKATNIEELTSRLVTLDESTRCRPDPARVALYAEKLEQFSRLTQRLREVEYL
ncbi:xylulokinase [Roseimicrobium gellanilyticum]|uniref:Xylulose kinase n=1 Tax=Roseimicrobium gellanilyticum TaxID=748857 RepID=A0A366HI82_9BACT|nr:xylulokinase [Roseimicrobium gellanilyticum]RBP42478.1 xylulokinase [Roseimicrobium gellanilyticum]